MPGVAAVLLAAGESSRMGQPKPCCPGASSLSLRYQVDSLTDAGATSIVVVLGPSTLDAESHVAGINGVRTVTNHRAAEGKTTSVRLGVSQVSDDAESVLLLAVDQPRTAFIMRRVIDAHMSGVSLITHPTYQGRGGHPIIFRRSLIPELLGVTEEREGIREVVSRHIDTLQRVELGDPMVRLDLNTMEDYEAALAEYGPWA